MTKTELAKMFAEATQLPATHAKEYLERLGDIMAAELLAGGEVHLPSIGKLVVKTTAARKGRNPRTGKEIAIKASKAVKFTPSKALKDSVK